MALINSEAELHQYLDESMKGEKLLLIPMLETHLHLDLEAAEYYFDTLFEELDCVLNCGDPYMAFYCTSAEIRKVTKDTHFGTYSTKLQFGLELCIDLELIIQDFYDRIGRGHVNEPNLATVVPTGSPEILQTEEAPEPVQVVQAEPEQIVQAEEDNVIKLDDPLETASGSEKLLDHNISPDGEDKGVLNTEHIRYGYKEGLDSNFEPAQPGCLQALSDFTKRVKAPFKPKREPKPGSTELGVSLHHINGKQFVKNEPI